MERESQLLFRIPFRSPFSAFFRNYRDGSVTADRTGVASSAGIQMARCSPTFYEKDR